MTDTEEKEYIQAFANGNNRAFELLFLYYQPRLVAFINGFIKDVEEARDMSQDIFLRLWENRQRCGEILSFKAFLFKTAKFAIYNHFDHQLVNDKYVELMLYTPTETDDTEERLFAQELQQLIELTVKNMPEQQRGNSPKAWHQQAHRGKPHYHRIGSNTQGNLPRPPALGSMK